jgi:hypothetical protein
MSTVENQWDRRQPGREKLQYARMSAIDILIEKLENFLEMFFISCFPYAGLAQLTFTLPFRLERLFLRCLCPATEKEL